MENAGHTVLIVTADHEAKHHYIKNGILHCPAITSRKFYNFGIASPISIHRLQLLKEFNPDIIHAHQEFGIGIFALHAGKETLARKLISVYENAICDKEKKEFLSLWDKEEKKYKKRMQKVKCFLPLPDDIDIV